MNPEFAPSNEPEFQAPNQTFQVFASEVDASVAKTRDENLSDLLKFSVPATIAGFADTFGTSVGLLNDGDTENYLRNTLPEFGDFYSRNKEIAQTVGDLTGMFLPGMAAVKLFRSGSFLFNTINTGRKSRLLNSVFSSGKTFDQLMRGVKARDRFLAKRGVIDVLQDTRRKQFARRATLTRVADNIKENIAFELGVLATMNDSQTLYPDEMSTVDLIALNAALPTVVGAAEFAFMKRAIRSSAQSIAPIAARARNTQDLPLDEIVNKPGSRDLGITVDALASSAAKQSRDQAAMSRMNRRDIAVSNLESAAREFDASVAKQVENLGTDNIIPQFTTRTSLSKGHKNTAKRIVETDPTSFLGAYSIENLPRTQIELNNVLDLQTVKVKELDARIEKLKAAKDPDNARITKLQKMRDQIEATEFYVFENTGDITIASGRKPLFTDGERSIKKFRKTDAEPAIYEIQAASDNLFGSRIRKIGFDETGNVIIPELKGHKISGIDVGKKVRKIPGDKTGVFNKFAQLTPFQRSAVYDGIRKAASDYKPGQPFEEILVSPTDHYTKLDYLTELHRLHGDDILNDFQLHPNLTTIDDIQWASLNGKFKEYAALRQFQDKAADNKILLNDRQVLNIDDVTKMLNLPGTRDGSIHPVVETFETLYQQGDTVLSDAIPSLALFKRQLQEDAFFPELTQFLNQDVGFMGNRTNIPADTAPFLVYKNPVNDVLLQRQGLIDAVQSQRTLQMDEMAKADQFGADLVKLVYDELIQNPSTKVAQQVDTLIEGIQRGRGLIATQVQAVGENPAILAMKSLEDVTDRSFRTALGKIFEPHTQKFSNLRSPTNRGHLESFNTFVHARRQGWDLAQDVVQQDGLNFFKLRDTARNRDRFQKLFGHPMAKDAMMPAPTKTSGEFLKYSPLGITDTAFDAVKSINELTSTTVLNTNHLKRIKGVAPTNIREFYIPPKNFANENVIFLVNESGNLHSVVHGKTLREARTNAEKEILATQRSGKTKLEPVRNTLFAVDQKGMQRYFSLQDDAFEKLMDFTDPLRQTGRGKGTQVGVIVDSGPDPLVEIIESINKQFESILRRSRATFFEPQIGYTRKMHNSSGSLEQARKGQTIWQQYLSSIFGNPTLNPNDIVGTFYFATESIYDDVISTVFDKIRGAASSTALQRSRKDATFNKLKDQLGSHNPFEDTVDFAARTFDRPLPQNMKKHAARLNQITSLLTLRLFEVGHSVLTLTSLMATLPGVVKAMSRNALETSEQHAARIGAFGHKIDDDVAMFNPIRALTTTIHDYFNDPKFRAAMKQANEMGFMDQQVSEVMRTLTHPREGYIENLVRRGTDVVSVLSDKSEILARGISFGVGYNIAKRGLGITDERLAFTFAHRTANETIGNYNPNNRPRIFQGALGMPLGLFMTFMWNYYQRVFNYVEAKDVKALVTQFATQAGVFGAQTVPGFQQFNEFFASNYDGSVNLVDGIQGRFGDEVAEWFLYGTLSNLPKMFGAEDGIALYTRGDVTFRNVPTVFTFQDTPIFAMFRDMWNATKETVGMLRQRGGVSSQQIAEIVSNYSTNRTFRALGYTFTGSVTDRKGQIVSDTPSFRDIIDGNVRNEIALMSRMVGMRTLSESRKAEAHARIRSAELSQRSRMNELRKVVRSDIRAGEFDQDAMNLALSNYIKYGGRAEYFPRWLSEQFMKSTVDKSLLELMKAIKDPTRSLDVERLLGAMVLPENDPVFGEPLAIDEGQ